MSGGQEPGGWRRLWRVINSPVLGPFLLAILFAAVSYYFIFST